METMMMNLRRDWNDYRMDDYEAFTTICDSITEYMMYGDYENNDIMCNAEYDYTYLFEDRMMSEMYY